MKKIRLPYKPKLITEQSEKVETPCQCDERHDYIGVQVGK